MKTRIITGLLLITVILPIVIIGNLPFLIFVYAILILALKEINHLFSRSHWPSYLKLCVYMIPLILFTSWPIYQTISFERILLMILIFLTISLFDERFSFNDMVSLIFILILVLTGFKMMLYVRHLPKGLDLMIYVALITFGTDTFAYFSGYLFGKHKLNPRISPKKTIEGAIGGTLIGSSLGIAYLLFRFEIFNTVNLFSILRIICFTFVLSISGQIGDLTFSAIKRHFSIKDFSQMLPGHGGILDRFDAFLFNFITFYIAMIVLSTNVAVIF